jgi:hypothetical protein
MRIANGLVDSFVNHLFLPMPAMPQARKQQTVIGKWLS